MFWLPFMAIGGIGGLVLLSRRARAALPANDSGDVNDIDRPDRPDPNIPAGKVDVRALAAKAGAPAIWQDFFAMTAYGESRSSPAVGLGIPAGAPPWIKLNSSQAEANAAAKVFKGNASWLAPCTKSWGEAVYKFGSGGLFAMLPAAAIAALKGDAALRCAHPWSLFDPDATMIYAAWFARRLQGWSNWTGTVGSMRKGWGNPSGMGKPLTADGRAKFSGHCEKVGLPASFLDATLPRWKPAPAGELWQTMGVDNGWLPTQEAA